MTDPAIIAASYAAERNHSHNPDDVIDASDAVGAWGTTKESTTKLVDLSGNGNIADIHGAMPTEGFIQGRRFDGDDDYLDCGNITDENLQNFTTEVLIYWIGADVSYETVYSKNQNNDFGRLLINPAGKILIQNGNGNLFSDSDNDVVKNKFTHILYTYNQTMELESVYVNNILVGQQSRTGEIVKNVSLMTFGLDLANSYPYRGIIYYVSASTSFTGEIQRQSRYNTLARLPFWSVSYVDYPDNVAEYTDNLPYSSSIISSGTFKVDDDKLQCVSAGTITYSAAYKFDGSEYIKIKIDGVEYAGTGTITQGNTTVSVAQGSNKITIAMGTGDTIDEINIQFREEV